MSNIVCKSNVKALMCLEDSTCFDILPDNTTSIGCLVNLTNTQSSNPINSLYNTTQGGNDPVNHQPLFIFMFVVVSFVFIILTILIYKGYIKPNRNNKNQSSDHIELGQLSETSITTSETDGESDSSI